MQSGRRGFPKYRDKLVAIRHKKTSTINRGLIFRAEDEARTRDNQLGRLELYQLSYFRIIYKLCFDSCYAIFFVCECKDSITFLSSKLFLKKNFCRKCFTKIVTRKSFIINLLCLSLHTKKI